MPRFTMDVQFFRRNDSFPAERKRGFMNSRSQRVGAVALMAALVIAVSSVVSCNRKSSLNESISYKDDNQKAYYYAYPMIAAYKAMYEFNIDKSNSQYKGPFNQILSDAQVFTPKDTAIVTPNSDTPYSMLQLDLRAEPMIFCVPEVEKGRYYSVQLTDMYSFNYGYVGSRATGNGAGCYMVVGPTWKGEKPDGVAKVFNSETEFGLVIFRTQLFGPADIDNVKKFQAQYTAQPLSKFLKQPAPPALPLPDFPKFTKNAFKTDAFSYLNFLLQFCPPVGPADVEIPLRARFAEIGIAPGNLMTSPSSHWRTA